MNFFIFSEGNAWNDIYTRFSCIESICNSRTGMRTRWQKMKYLIKMVNKFPNLKMFEIQWKLIFWGTCSWGSWGLIVLTLALMVQWFALSVCLVLNARTQLFLFLFPVSLHVCYSYNLEAIFVCQYYNTLLIQSHFFCMHLYIVFSVSLYSL